MADDTGSIGFLSWDPIEVEVGQLVKIDGASVRTFRDTPELNFGRTTTIETYHDAAFATAEDLEAASAQRFELAMQQLRARTERTRLAVGATLVLALLAAGVSMFAMTVPSVGSGASDASVAGADVAGDYTCTVTYPWARAFDERLSLRHAESGWTGTMSVFGVPRELVALTVDDEDIQFLVELALQGGDVSTYQYAGKVRGDQIAFTLIGGSASATSPLVFSAVRRP